MTLETHVWIWLVGCGATLCMDGWAVLQKKLLGIPSLNYALVGRWVLGMPRGIMVHRPITASAAMKGGTPAGWVLHYLIGIGLAYVPVLMSGTAWLASPSPGIALLTGLCSVAAPFLMMQPALGFGIAASKTPRPMKVRALSLLAHLMFGAGLYLAAQAVACTLAALLGGEFLLA